MPLLQARFAELNYRVLACAEDVADAHGARDVGDYVAHETRQAHGTLARELRAARELDTRWRVLQEALRGGRVNLAQSVEITRALNALPADLDAKVLADAERVLVEHAERFTPHELRRLGKRIVDVVAPEIAEALEGERLADEERSARERQQLSLKPQGDGTTRITGLLTDGCANRLATALNAITNPRRDHLSGGHFDPAPCGCQPDGAGKYGESCGDLDCPGHDPHEPLAGKAKPLRKLSTPHRNARALNTLLESLDPKRLPLHGGDATTVVVTISLDALRTEIGTASISSQRDAWDDRISAGEARRLACNAGIIPVVLGGKSQPLDLGRTRRLYSPAQHKALAIKHPYCQAEGCRIPATWCEAHHRNPWQFGGNTDLDDGELLCGRHHHYIHDPGYTVERMPYGGIRFTRRI
ncbi:DUF222 domain-containing protein [Nocardioides sp. Bht2]|uniref:HNH endonuclease signature motif containing protein n=1 Tax=Nocardioides sp. Bht2 TaxID=3392297 RepID=UPI0039B591DF